MKCPFNRKECMKKDCQLWQEYVIGSRNDPTAPAILEGNCALAWGPIFHYDANIKLMGVQQATESFRNDSLQRQDALLSLAVDRRMLSER